MLRPIVVRERQIGAISEGTIAGMGVAGVTIASAVGGAFWGVIIGLIAEAATKKNYGHGAAVGAGWGAGVGGALGLAAGLTVAGAASSTSPSASSTQTTAQGTNTSSTSDGLTGS